MTAVPKPAARHKDADLLGELKLLWREFGCAICGSPVAAVPPDGFDVELHHVDNKPRHDYPWNIVGLCGEMTDGQCHHLVTTNVYEIRRNDRGFLVWRDRRAGGQLWAPLRFVPTYSQVPPAGATAESNGEATPPPVEPVAETDAVHPPDGSTSDDPPQVPQPAVVAVDPATAGPPSPDDPPEVRAGQIRERVTRSKRLLMEAAILLRHAYERDDHQALGVSWADYYSSLGLESSNVTKMLTAARVLGDEWQQLTPAAREHVSVEQLYQASLLVTRNEWGTGAAIDAAVSNPTSRLIALRTGDEPADKCRCSCPNCGRELYHDRGA